MSDNIITKLEIVPGIYKGSTSVDSTNRWVNGDKVRFRDGKPEKIGGWAKNNTRDPLLGVARDITTWEDNEGRVFTAIGTNRKLYVLYGGTYYDVTPIESTESVINNLSTTSGSSLVNIELTSHGRRVGDYVVFFTPVGPIGTTITLSEGYEITEIVDDNNFIIDSGVVATSTESNVGGSYDLSLELPFGGSSNTALTGYGSGSYGLGTYGTERQSTALDSRLRLWSLNKWGNGLIASPSGGAIYYWESAATISFSDRAEIIPTAPQRNLIVKVYDKLRQVISFGCDELISGDFNPLLVRWSSAEDFTDWTPTDSNEAGDYPLESGGEIVAVSQTKSEILVGTFDTTYIMRYRGAPFYFGFDTVGKNTNFVGKNSIVEVNGALFWFGEGGFYGYNGSIQLLPSSLQDFIFDPESSGRLNISQKEKVHAGVNTEFSEIIWFYPAGTSQENNRYVIYNYRDKIWYDGTLNRTAWCSRSESRKPIAINSSGQLYNHEVGKNDDAAPLHSFIESGSLSLMDGDNMIFVDKYIPDIKGQVGVMSLTVGSRKYPNATEVTKGPYMFSATKQYLNFRSRGRQFKFKFESNVNNGNYQIGSIRFSIKVDGRR